MAVNLVTHPPAHKVLICRPCSLQVSLMWSRASTALSRCSGSRLRKCYLPPAPEALRQLGHISPTARLWLALLSCTGQKKSLHRPACIFDVSSEKLRTQLELFTLPLVSQVEASFSEAGPLMPPPALPLPCFGQPLTPRPRLAEWQHQASAACHQRARSRPGSSGKSAQQQAWLRDGHSSFRRWDLRLRGWWA